MISLGRVLREVGALNLQPDTPPAVHKQKMQPPSTYPPMPSLYKSRSNSSDQSDHKENPAIFFSATKEIPEHLEELWTLKRATPIDEEDTEPWLESPSKRLRRTFSFFDPVPESRDDEEDSHHRVKELSASVQIQEEQDGFTVVLL